MRILKKLFSDRSGNFGILGAIAIVPILGSAGMAVDFSRAMDLRWRLQIAADAAVLGAISEKSEGVTQAVGMTNDGRVSRAEKEAAAFFRAELAANTNSISEGGTGKDDTENLDSKLDMVQVKVTRAGKDIKANLTYRATIKTSFLRVLGKDTITVSGTANAVFQSESFMDFYLLLDNTPSMGVASTTADIEKMIKATKNVSDSGSRNCAFACHIVSEKGVVDTGSNYAVAKANNISIRIDAVAKAVVQLTAEAERQQSYPNQFRMATYTFGETAMDTKLFKVASLTGDLSKVKKTAEGIKLMSIPKQGYNNDQQTDFDNALTKIGDEITQVGNGLTASSPEKFVFFVSDGVGDSYKPKGCTAKLSGSRCQEPIDTKSCAALKARGIKIAVLYTTYLPLPNNDWYNQWIKPFQTTIGTKMQECASPGFYFEVPPSQNLEGAMKILFNKVVHTPRLTS